MLYIWPLVCFLSYSGPAEPNTKVTRGPLDKSVEVLLSSVVINVSRLPLKSELDGIVDSDTSTASFADCFILDSI